MKHRHFMQQLRPALRHAWKQWSIGLLIAIATLISVVSVHTPTQAQEPAPAPITLETAGLSLEEVASGVYSLIASTDFPPADMATTAICNGTIVIGSDSVLVIDPFQNEALGNLLLETAATLTDQPVRYVVNTHYHFDHTGGNPAAEAKALPILGRGPIRSFMLTRNVEMDPNPTPPDIVVSGPGELWLGDRQVEIMEAEGHSGGTDLVVYVPDADVLVAGDLLFHQRIPYMADGNIRLWMESLDHLIDAYPTATVVPGHGSLTDRQGLELQRAYFADLESLALAWKESGLSLEQAVSTTTIPDAYADYLFQPLFPGNLEVAYQQITLGQEDAASIQAYAQAQAIELQGL